MKIYKKIFFALAFSLFAITSCNEDLLEVQDQNRLNPDVFWRSGDDAQRAVIGAYSPLVGVHSWGRMMILHTVYRSDATNPIPFQGVTTDAANFSIEPTFGRLQEAWGEFWKTILRANTLLVQVPNIEDSTFSDTERNQILGEAHFLRAFQYFYLVTMFRNVPLITEPAATIAEIKNPPAEPEVIWQQIISDLKMAQSLLPEQWDEDNLGRATWGAATGLLGKTHLYRSGLENVDEYALAAAEFQKIMAKEGSLYNLMPQHADNFGSDKENNMESLFEIQMDNNGSAWGSDNAGSNHTAAFESDLSPPGFTSQSGMWVNTWVKDAFLAEQTTDATIDPRAFNTIAWNEEGVMMYENTFQEAFPANLDAVAIRKYLDFRTGKDQPQFGGPNASVINFRIMRYADILLMYAEAQNEAVPNSPLALEALNKVRARSSMPLKTASDQATLRQQIRDERVLELLFEGDRYHDLLRWGMIPDVITNELKSNMGGSQYRQGREYLPIPQVEVDTNPLYPQNPGYN